MRKGPRTKILSTEEVEVLNQFRLTERLSFAGLGERMKAPFHWQVLKRAMDGGFVNELNYHFLTSWIAANLAIASTTKEKS